MSIVLPPSARAFQRAAELLRQGRLVAFPTETVYGLGCDAHSPAAVDRLYKAKRRERNNPLIVHVAHLHQARALAHFGAKAERLARAFWPGALTLVLPVRARGLPQGVATSLGSVAVRLPDSVAALGVLEAFGAAVAAPSANRSQSLSPSQAAHVVQAFEGSVEPSLIIDGGTCRLGLESSVLSLLEEARPRLLRPGALTRAALEAELGCRLTLEGCSEAAALSPGNAARHYAPRRRLRLNVVRTRATRDAQEAYLTFGRVQGGDINLSPAGDLHEAAKNLYSALHRVDRSPYASIAVSPIPEEGLGEALNDRLRRAAHPAERQS